MKKKDDVMVISIGVGAVPAEKLKKKGAVVASKMPVKEDKIKNKDIKKELVKGKPTMQKGGMANGKVHMYSAGGAVTDRLSPGLKALNKKRPDVVKKILKK